MGLREGVAVSLDVEGGLTPDMETSPEEAIFYGALQRSGPAEREEFLQEACAGNDVLRQEVDRLLASHANADTFLQKLGSKLSPQEWCPEAQTYTDASVGAFIGPYRLGECLGEGGGGIVYLAGQETPVRCQVALKIIKLGMDTKRVIVRFEAERQTLAMMEHPNIARVFDAAAPLSKDAASGRRGLRRRLKTQHPCQRSSPAGAPRIVQFWLRVVE